MLFVLPLPKKKLLPTHQKGQQRRRLPCASSKVSAVAVGLRLLAFNGSPASKETRKKKLSKYAEDGALMYLTMTLRRRKEHDTHTTQS